MAWDSENFTTYNTDLNAQRIDSGGNLLWGASGIAVSTLGVAGMQYAVSDGSGGMIVSYNCENGSIPCDVYGYFVQRVDNSGAILWQTGGVQIATTTPHNYPLGNPVEDGAGGAVIAWADDRKINGGGNPTLPSGTDIDTDIYVQRIDNLGTKLWGATGMPVATADGHQSHPYTTRSSTTQEFLVVWSDARSGESDIYAQKVDINGNKLWAENGVPVCACPGGQYLPFAVSDGADGFIIVWKDDRVGVDVYAQRLDSNGQLLWQSDGVPIATTSEHEIAYHIVLDGNGGAVLSFGNKIQRIDSSGRRLWPTEGLQIGSGPIGDLIAVDSSTFLVVWEDNTRESGFNWQVGDIMMQQVRDLPGPEPPFNLTATPLEGRKIELHWVVSPSTNVSHYNIYYDSATGVIDYYIRITSVPASSATFTAGPLTDGVAYKFGIRAVDANGVEELNTDVVASAVAMEALSVQVKASIKVPQSGRKVTGNRLTIAAELVQGDSFDVRDIRFQYRDAITTTTAWQDVIPATARHPNPDADFPYFVHWDISAFPEGSYELRAVAASRSGAADPAPATIFVTIDHADPQVEETALGSGIRKRQTVNNTTANTIQAGGGQEGSLMKLILPADSLNSSAATLKIVTDPAGLPAVPRELASGGSFSEITLESGQTQLLNGRLAAMTVFYPDADNDGIVDGTVARADRLALYAYDPAAGNWERLAGSVDTGQRTVFAQTSHFSLFGLFAPAAADLSDVLVYPVPWVPNDGIADNGKPYNSADPDSGIIFNDITQSARIQIYTITGELVWEKTTDASSGKVQWDGRNRSGRNAASGGYFAVITDTATGSRVTRKIAVIR